MSLDYLIAGCGFSGAVLAERIARVLGKNVLIVDRRPHIGGNAYDSLDHEGILVHNYGPHIFHTNSDRVVEYLSEFTGWRPYAHRVVAEVEGKRIPVPYNLDSLHATFPAGQAAAAEKALFAEYGEGSNVPILRMLESPLPLIREVAEYAYRTIFEGYTKKQWELDPKELDPSVTGRVPMRISRDDRYFQDKHQAMPVDGYTPLFERILDHSNIRVELNCEFDVARRQWPAARPIYTGPIDALFGYKFGPLPYRSLEFRPEVHDGGPLLPCATVNYPNAHDYTRITEMRWLTGQQHTRTSLFVEYPRRFEEGVNERYYPIPQPHNAELYARYQAELAATPNAPIVLGRLGDYRYYNMDQAVARALNVFERQIAPEAARR